MALAAAWLVAFLAFFNTFTLPNSNPQVSRLDVWRALPDVFLGLIFPEPDPKALPSGWQYFPQRFDLMAVAAAIFLGAWALGRLALRLLRIGRRMTRLERFVFSCGGGLSLLSLITLGCGLAGMLDRRLLGGVLIAAVVAELVLCFAANAGGVRAEAGDVRDAVLSRRWNWGLIAVVSPFLLAMFLGAMLPSVDFDVKEYHLQGPKEFFQNGRVKFLPHNVYTSFPFLTEMLSLLAMVLRNDWFRGALAGKLVLMGFAPLSALAVFATAKRFFGEAAGRLAALIFLTTPWTYRISIIAYAEGGLTFFLAATLLATIVATSPAAPRGEKRSTFASLLLAGFFAGSAMACKYPGIVQVVIPLGIAAVLWKKSDQPAASVTGEDTARADKLRPLLLESPRVAARGLAAFALGTAMAVGPWLAKNAVETGNPVYPLLYSVFGGRDWDAQLNARWLAAHSPENYALADLGRKFIDVTAKSDWLSPLLFAFAPLALLWDRREAFRRSTVLWLFAAYLFAAWWLLTHRIDRFWIPMIPVVAVLAGAGAAWCRHRLWQAVAGVAVAAAVIFNLGFVLTPLCGYNAYLADLDAARKQSTEISAPGIGLVNRLPKDARVLCVGEAQVFDARRPVVYNTVFDHSIFREWCGAAASDTAAEDLPLRPAAEIRRTLREEGITHLFVNWEEVQRYRRTYGYTKFVAPARFAELQRMGVLGPAVEFRDRQGRLRFQMFPVRR